MTDFEIDLLKKYFPNICEFKINQFSKLFELYRFWNSKINVISTNDINNLFIRHILHSLSIAKIFTFIKTDRVIDVGSGGGFPGIPLAIMFPETGFTLIDSIGKKVKVVEEIFKESQLKNIRVIQKRSNEFKGNYDFITGRSVTAFPKFYNDVIHLLNKKSKSKEKGGIIYLKGGDFEEEISQYKKVKVFKISDIFEDEFYQTKKIIYLPTSS